MLSSSSDVWWCEECGGEGGGVGGGRGYAPNDEPPLRIYSK